jgi:4,5-dihydroxyphthalate decarboxylase
LPSSPNTLLASAPPAEGWLWLALDEGLWVFRDGSVYDVQPEGIDVTYLAITSPPEIFSRQIKTGAFDIAEMSLAMYFTRKAGGDFPFIALPVFPARVFRHAYIFVNRDLGIEQPRDLEGRRIGVQQYRQTAATWVRGILQHEYDVDLSTMIWVEGGVNAPRPPDADMDILPAGKNIDITSAPAGKSINELLIEGDIAAYFGARKPNALNTHPNIERLFPKYREVERDYYRRTGIFPIMHTLVMREALYRENAWVAESMYKALEESKRWALERMGFSGTMSYMVPWLNTEMDEIEELFGGDPYPYGLESNRNTLETLMQYLVDQGFVERPGPAIEDMFTPIVAWSE